MYCVSVGASVGLRWAMSCLLAVLIIASLTTDSDARWRKRGGSRTNSAAITSESRYADIVVDANTGDVLHAMSPDSQRHPASLTKIMTLYLLFERLDAGRLKLDTPLEVSGNASEQAPSKLGLQPGQTIAVEDAIKALVTKSANDVAVVIAEAVAGSEDEFAKLMTRKARALGMSRTTYKNASGLPDDDQVTTARDQALLSLAIQDRFPKYYPYFSTPRFSYRGNWMRNHNHLLGRVAGVDGIKTGYTRASGFNLITSVRRGPRHVVAVVFGGRSAGQRDARMQSLIEANIDDAAIKRSVPKAVETAESPAAAKKKVRVAVADEPPASAAPAAGAKRETSAKPDTTSAIPVPRPAPGSTEPIKPLLVKTLTVKPGSTQVATLAPLSLLSPQPVTSMTHVAQAQAETLPPPPPGARPGVLGVLPVANVAAAEPKSRLAVPEPKTAIQLASAEAKSASASAAPAIVPSAPPRARVGWIIQVGAFDDEAEARQRLESARGKASKLLGGADPFTETVAKGDKTLYRARFAGLKQADAEAACRYLKRNDIVCMAIRN